MQRLCGRGLVEGRGDDPPGLSVKQSQSTKRSTRGAIRRFFSRGRPEAYPTGRGDKPSGLSVPLSPRVRRRRGVSPHQKTAGVSSRWGSCLIRDGPVEPRFLAPPAGCTSCWGRGPGVVAALDFRRPTETPPGSVVARAER
jgi:hypothetical protein